MFIDYVEVNNVVLSSINEYALEYDRKCIEGEINEYGIVLSFSGKLVDKNKSYSNMKGGLFNKELIEYKKAKRRISRMTFFFSWHNFNVACYRKNYLIHFVLHHPK